MLINQYFITILGKTKTENYGSALFIKIEVSIVNINRDGKGLSLMKDNRDLKQTGRQRDDDGYSHNDIPDLVQKK